MSGTEREMLSKSLTKTLESYQIGPKIRMLRTGKKLGLVQLGDHTGLSPALLSKIERGQLFPTLPTLVRIAQVFGLGLEHFFEPDRARPVVALVRRSERIRLPDRPGKRLPAYHFESLDYPVSERKLNGYYVDIEAQETPSEAHEHPGAEIVYVLRGELVINIAGDDYALHTGDSIYFDSAHAHTYRRRGQGHCSAVVVVTA
jgi:transcriptional regulator with XRE-family HTH domain